MHRFKVGKWHGNLLQLTLTPRNIWGGNENEVVNLAITFLALMLNVFKNPYEKM